MSDMWNARVVGPPNKGMKLTKLSAAPFRGTKCRLMPAPSRLDAGTASQLIPVFDGAWEGNHCGISRAWWRSAPRPTGRATGAPQERRSSPWGGGVA
jgi:hypothetical protein